MEGSIRLSTLKAIAMESSSREDIPKENEEKYWRSIFHIEEPVQNLTEMLDRVCGSLC